MKTNLTQRHVLWIEQKSISQWATAVEDHTPVQNRILRLRLSEFTKKRPEKIGKVSSGLISQFLLPHSDGRIKLWWERHESMDPSWLLSTIQAGVGLIVTLHEYFCWSSVYEHSIYWWLLPAGKHSMSQKVKSQNGNEFTELKWSPRICKMGIKWSPQRLKVILLDWTSIQNRDAYCTLVVF